MTSILLNGLFLVVTAVGGAGLSPAPTSADAGCCGGAACCDKCPACCVDCCGADCCGQTCCGQCPACCK